MGIFWENSFWVFFFLTLILAGGAAWMTGRACALTWRPLYLLTWFMLLLAVATRFLHFGLFGETLVSLHYLLVTFVYLLVVGLLGWRATRTSQMVTQYPWLYEKVTPFSWRDRVQPSGGTA